MLFNIAIAFIAIVWCCSLAFILYKGGLALYKYSRKVLDGKFTTLSDTLVFAVRGTFTARYSSGGPTALGFGNTAPSSAADVGALSGNSIQFAANNNLKAATWPGKFNTPNGRVISILVRFRPNYSGAPAATKQIIALGGGGGIIRYELGHSTAGNLVVNVRNETSATAINTASAGAWSPVSGTWYDIVMTWDGTTSANAVTVYVDAVAIGTITAAAAISASWTNQYFDFIQVGWGVGLNGTNSADRFDEIVLWGNIIDPTNVVLESGAGSLNGASRVSLVAATAFDGSVNSDPGIANVKSGVSYTIAGTSLTGTLVSSSGTAGFIYGGPGNMGRN